MAAISLIEGIGDEVTAFFLLALLGVLAVLAWWTTHVADRPLRIQTIIVGQRVIHVQGEEQVPVEETGEQTEGVGGGEGQVSGEGAEEDCEDEADGVTTGTAEDQASSERQAVSTATAPVELNVPNETQVASSTVEPGVVASTNETSVTSARDSAPVPSAKQERESEAPVTACPPLEQIVGRELRARRLAHFQRLVETTRAEASTSSHDASSAASTPDAAAANLPSCSAAEVVSPGEERTTHAEGTDAPASATAELASVSASSDGEASSGSRPAGAGRSIMVKLKFLNDTQKLVEGSRQEALAEFKRRHFPAETAANRLVRLIFNGRLLPDTETLDQCGFYDNCVVHCHVSSEPRPSLSANTADADDRADDQLDLSMLLLPALTTAVTLTWGVRMRYPEMFSTLASALLALMTLLLAVFTAATLLPLQRTAGGAEQRQQRRGR